jgi:hypothetical protein
MRDLRSKTAGDDTEVEVNVSVETFTTDATAAPEV